ncbi:MAG: flagellar filament capping protein FliD [Leptospirillia bacterium]
MGITVGGLSSGLPPDLIDQLVEIQYESANALADKKVEQQTRLSAVQSLNTKLLTLKGVMDGLATKTTLSTRAAAVTNASASTTSYVSASVDSSTTAAVGTYTITDVVLATNEQFRHTGGVADKSDVLSSGTFAFKYAGGTEQQVTISGSETMLDLQSKINALDAGVTATIINDGSKDYLVLTGDDEGASNTISITANTTITGFTSSDFTDVNGAGPTDATFKIDGLTITSSSNINTTAIEGVTLTLNEATASETMTLSVTRDNTALEDKIKSFVESYNTVATELTAHTKYDADTGSKTVLFGDSAIRGIQYQMRDTISNAITGLTGTYNTLAELGITTNTKDGTLSIDDAKLTKAIDTDFDGVSAMFYEDPDAGTSGYASLLATYVGSITDISTGIMAGKASAISDRIATFDSQISEAQQRADIKAQRIRTQFQSLESLIFELKSATDSSLQSLQSLANNPITLNQKK